MVQLATIYSQLIKEKYYNTMSDISRNIEGEESKAVAKTQTASVGNIELYTRVVGLKSDYTINEIYIKRGSYYKIALTSDIEDSCVCGIKHVGEDHYNPTHDVKCSWNDNILNITAIEGKEEVVFRIYYNDIKNFKINKFEIETKYC